MREFIRFLVKAKKNTYASNGEAGEDILKDGAKELSYKLGNFYYRDRYYGSSQFIGEEVVFLNNKPFWAMNYAGGCFKNIISKGDIYGFLKKCLKKASADNPFRGPDVRELGNYIYKNKFKGDISSFFGEESIYYKKKKVYKLNYHGGLIK